MSLDPQANWVFVMDNLNIHCSESLVRLVAEACGIETDRGKKGIRGVLKSQASRGQFLRNSYVPINRRFVDEIRYDSAVLAGSGLGERVDDFQLDRVAFDEVRELLFERRHVQ